MGRHRTPYPAEFRAHMVELVKAGRTPKELAREFDMTLLQRCQEVVIHHSDQACQPTSIAFGRRCRQGRCATLDGHRWRLL